MFYLGSMHREISNSSRNKYNTSGKKYSYEGVNGHIIMEHLGILVCITYITNEKPRENILAHTEPYWTEKTMFIFYYSIQESIPTARRKKDKMLKKKKKQRASFESKIFLYNHG